MIIYTDLISKDAVNLFFVILIRPQFKDDRALIAHHRIHVRQVWKWLILQPILYHVSRGYRMKFEVEAYKESIRWGMPLSVAAMRLWKNYDLDISYDVALWALST